MMVSIKDSGIFENFTDIHSHILCGVDDGCRTASESEQMIARMAKLGFKKCTLTPHIMASMYNNSVEKLEREYDKHLAHLAEKYDIELALGAEYMIDNGFLERFKTGVLPIVGNNILCELPMSREIGGWQEIFRAVIKLGYTPVLAHPERYAYFSEQTLRKIKDMGVLLQMNFLSLQGFYGSSSMKRAYGFLQLGLFDHLASDVHYLSMIGDIEDHLLEPWQVKKMMVLAENNAKLY